MYKYITKSLTAVMVSSLLVMCTKSNDDSMKLSTRVTIPPASAIGSDQSYAQLFFSTDGGTTYQQFPQIKVGQKVTVKVVDTNTGDQIKASDFYSFDWSGSNPKPSDATSDTPEFTLTDNNLLYAAIVDQHCAFVPTDFTGAWHGKESQITGQCNCTSNDPQTITQDATNPNKLIMNNYWGDGVGNATVYMIFNPSTTAYDQTVIIPTQVTEEGGTAYGTGVYDACRGTITLTAHYDFSSDPADQYEWKYTFTKP